MSFCGRMLQKCRIISICSKKISTFLHCKVIKRGGQYLYIVWRQIYHGKRTIIVKHLSNILQTFSLVLILSVSSYCGKSILQELQGTANGTTCNITEGITDLIKKETCSHIHRPLLEDKVDYIIALSYRG